MSMSAFPDSKQLHERLLKPDRFSSEEIHGLLARLPCLTGEAAAALQVRLDAESMLALSENTEAIKNFDESSRRLNRWLIGLTVVLVVLTLVIAGFTIVLVVKK
jgi:hypothetical protein